MSVTTSTTNSIAIDVVSDSLAGSRNIVVKLDIFKGPLLVKTTYRNVLFSSVFTSPNRRSFAGNMQGFSFHGNDLTQPIPFANLNCISKPIPSMENTTPAQIIINKGDDTPSYDGCAIVIVISSSINQPSIITLAFESPISGGITTPFLARSQFAGPDVDVTIQPTDTTATFTQLPGSGTVNITFLIPSHSAWTNPEKGFVVNSCTANAEETLITRTFSARSCIQGSTGQTPTPTPDGAHDLTTDEFTYYVPANDIAGNRTKLFFQGTVHLKSADGTYPVAPRQGREVGMAFGTEVFIDTPTSGPPGIRMFTMRNIPGRQGRVLGFTSLYLR